MLILSCGKAVKHESEAKEEDSELLDGTYAGLLVPVNSKVSINIQGDVRVSKYSDEFKVEVRVKGAPAGFFVQGLHTGSRCPMLDSDKNFDGYLDVTETRESVGQMVVPFDGDLSSQYEGRSLSLSGNYRYHRTTSYYLMLSDLHTYDEVANDSIVKLKERELPIERKVVGIYVKKKNLPYSVSGTEILVACGALTRVSNDENSGDTWEEQDDSDQDTYRRPRKPRPPRRPPPEPEPEVEPEPSTGGSWWDRLRQGWRRWRNRWGGDGSGSSNESSTGGAP